MSALVNKNLVRKFVLAQNLNHVTERTAKEKLGINKTEFNEANTDENNYLEIDELLEDDKVFEKLAVLYSEELERSAAESDEEKEKEKQKKVSGAGNSAKS